MATTVITAVSTGIPADDIVAGAARGSEGGSAAARAAAALLLPGRTFGPVRTITLVDGSDPDSVRLSTYGDTVLLLGTDPGELTVPPSSGVFSLTYESVSMTYALTIHSPARRREVIIGQEGVVLDEGEPLPFETSYWAGEHDRHPGEDPAFDSDEWARAGALWMFGYDPSDLTADPRGLAAQPSHLLPPAGAAQPPETDGPDHRWNRRWNPFRRG